MLALRPVSVRTTKQLLKRLYEHFNGLPIPPGHVLASIAKTMPLVERSAEIVFLAKPKSIWIEHAIMVLDDEIILDHNVFLYAAFKDGVYTAVDQAGRPVKLEPRKSISIEDFIVETELYNRFRVNEPSPADQEAERERERERQ